MELEKALKEIERMSISEWIDFETATKIALDVLNRCRGVQCLRAAATLIYAALLIEFNTIKAMTLMVGRVASKYTMDRGKQGDSGGREKLVRARGGNRLEAKSAESVQNLAKYKEGQKT